MSVSCPACGATVPEEGKFCPACGMNRANRAKSSPSSSPSASASPPAVSEPLTIICPHCDTTLSADTRFCRACGRRIDLSSSLSDDDQPVPSASLAHPAATSASPPASSAPSAPQKPQDGRRNMPVYVAAIVILLVLALGIGSAVFFLRTETPEVVVVPPPAETPQAGNPGQPQNALPASTSPAQSAQSAQSAPQARERAATPAPKPVAVNEASVEQSPPRNCNRLSPMSELLCRTEGPKRFWKCAPDGNIWNNDIPGCRRNAKARNTPY